MRLLFGWEFGSGLGHLTRFRPIGAALRKHGIETVAALQEIDAGRALCDPETGRLPDGLSIIPAPRWIIPNDPKLRQIPTHSFADVLNLIGYGQSAAMAVRMEAWQGLIDTIKPDLVLTDFAPTLNVVARGQVPVISVGNGYTTPPEGRALPPIRPWQKRLEAFSVTHEKTILNHLNENLARLGRDPIKHFGDAFHGDETFVFSLPLVDPYARFRKAKQLPPFNLPQNLTPLPAADRQKDRVLFYFPGNHPRIKVAIEAAKTAGLDTVGFISDLKPEIAPQISAPGFEMRTSPINFSEELPRARLIIHHGGLSTAVAAIAAGTPQIILPWNLEHQVTAQGVTALGTTRVWADKDGEAGPLSDALRKMAGDDKLIAKAMEAAGRIDLGTPGESLKTVVDACLARMGALPEAS